MSFLSVLLSVLPAAEDWRRVAENAHKPVLVLSVWLRLAAHPARETHGAHISQAVGVVRKASSSQDPRAGLHKRLLQALV